MAAKGEAKPGRPDAAASLAAHTDSYFLKTKAIVGQFGDRHNRREIASLRSQ